MFGPITLPFGAKMLFNTVKLKPGVTFEDVELAVGELCSVVKGTYGGDKGGFLAGQVFKFSGFVSKRDPSLHQKPPTTIMLSSPIGVRSKNTSDPMRTRFSPTSSPHWRPCVPTPKNWDTTCYGKVRQRAISKDAPHPAASLSRS